MAYMPNNVVAVKLLDGSPMGRRDRLLYAGKVVHFRRVSTQVTSCLPASDIVPVTKTAISSAQEG